MRASLPGEHMAEGASSPSASTRCTVRLANTKLGDESLTLAADGILDVSAGFQVPPGGDRWPRTDVRRIEHAVLRHVALTADTAYESARVLAVRTAAAAPA